MILQKQKKPKLFWVSAIAPIVTVVTGCFFAYFAHAEKHGIPIVSFSFSSSQIIIIITVVVVIVVIAKVLRQSIILFLKFTIFISKVVQYSDNKYNCFNKHYHPNIMTENNTTIVIKIFLYYVFLPCQTYHLCKY